MPNRTIYLPDDLDDLSRRLGLNLSRLTQQAIEQLIKDNNEQTLQVRMDAATARARELGIEWPDDLIRRQRSEAQER